MAQKKGLPPIAYIVLLLGLVGGGYWFLTQKKPAPIVNSPGNNAAPPANAGNQSPALPVESPSSFEPPTTVASGTTVRIDGSTSMVGINQALKQGFEQQFPGTTVATSAKGSSSGIQALLANQIDVAASSRPLKPEEKSQGLMELTVAEDAIALIVGDKNLFRRGLTQAQVIDIFEGRITDWSQVGGAPSPMRVINRPAISGTHQAFQEIVLKGSSFGSNLETLDQDATTPLIRALQSNGIGYATYQQVANQQTARTLAIDGLTPEAASYPLKRKLYYIYRQSPSPAAQAFLGFATSPKGQQIVSAGG
jgi:phosphate transport system substrate-binding protein